MSYCGSTRGNTRLGTNSFTMSSKKSDSDSTCPTCGETFKNQHGMHTHHSQVHGESISGFTYPCEECGSTVEYTQRRDGCEHFCSKECESDYREKNGRLIGVDGIDHPSANGEMIDCKQCGETFYCKESHLERRSFCSVDCVANYLSNRTGEDHPRWKENTPPKYFYSSERWRQTREKVLERDDYKCQVCGKQDGLNIHHIQPISDGGAKLNPDNLVTFCATHHKKWEGLYLRPDTR